jgi:hypothetical protein
VPATGGRPILILLEGYFAAQLRILSDEHFTQPALGMPARVSLNMVIRQCEKAKAEGRDLTPEEREIEELFLAQFSGDTTGEYYPDAIERALARRIAEIEAASPKPQNGRKLLSPESHSGEQHD